METIKTRKEKMRVVRTVLLAIIFSSSLSCSKKLRTKLYEGGTFVKEEFKSKDKFTTVITCEFYHDDSKNEKSFAVININGVMPPIVASDKFVFNVLPGTYRIESGFPGKKWTVIKNLKMEEGDSIAFKIFLEDDDRPLVD
jgi:hypothetical protein